MSYGYNVPAVKWKTCNQAKKNEVIQGDTWLRSRTPRSASLQTGHRTSQQTHKLPPALRNHQAGDGTSLP